MPTTHREGFHPATSFIHAAIWVCAAIVLGITAWFKSMTETDGGRHLVYQLVVAVLTLVLWPAIWFLSRREGTVGHHAPLLALAFSYLWLASTVVSIDDWADDACHWTWPWERCAYKHTVIAFNFLAFILTAANVMIAGWFAPTTYRHGITTKHHTTTTRV